MKTVNSNNLIEYKGWQLIREKRGKDTWIIRLQLSDKDLFAMNLDKSWTLKQAKEQVDIRNEFLQEKPI